MRNIDGGKWPPGALSRVRRFRGFGARDKRAVKSREANRWGEMNDEMHSWRYFQQCNFLQFCFLECTVPIILFHCHKDHHIQSRGGNLVNISDSFLGVSLSGEVGPCQKKDCSVMGQGPTSGRQDGLPPGLPPPPPHCGWHKPRQIGQGDTS